MRQLIKITEQAIGSESVNSVDARELWAALGSKQEFAHWVKAKVVDNPFFEENQDYILLDNSNKQSGRGGHNKKDYAVTQDTAKKVAMAEQTDAGNKVRDYFLECEKIAKAATLPKELSRMEILKLAMDSEEARIKAEKSVKRLEVTNKKMVPKAESFDAFIDSWGRHTLREAFKILGQKPNLFTGILRDKGVLYTLNKNNVPKQEYIERGYFEIKSVTNNKLGKTFSQTYVTTKGLDWLRRRFISVNGPSSSGELFGGSDD